MSTQSFAQLSGPRQALARLLQETNFGEIPILQVRGDEPVMDPAPDVILDIKLGGQNGPRPERDRGDFALKSELLELFEHLDSIGDGKLESIQVRHGLPFTMRRRKSA
jgi:hypothetical protein